VFGSLAAFAGLIVIVIQFGLLERRDAPAIPESEKVGLELSLRTVYSVFVGWIAMKQQAKGISIRTDCVNQICNVTDICSYGTTVDVKRQKPIQEPDSLRLA